MRIITISWSAINRFKKTWPCHNIHEDADLIVVAIKANGDLVDYEICDDEDNIIVENEDASAALLALFGAARVHAVNMTPESLFMDNWIYA